jgi:hypothetical protein
MYIGYTTKPLHQSTTLPIDLSCPLNTFHDSTGTAAALIGGYTYHSVLGINDKSGTAASLANVRTCLNGVEYMFLDEVSMLSCQDFYKISAQLAKAFNESNAPFGGMNMIFAGDFSQLPPVGSGESVSLYSGNICHDYFPILALNPKALMLHH